MQGGVTHPQDGYPASRGVLPMGAYAAAPRERFNVAACRKTKRPDPRSADRGAKFQQSERRDADRDMRAAPPRGGITTPRRLSRFPGLRLGLLSAPSHPTIGGTVACADFNAAHSCGAAMVSLRGPRRMRMRSLTIFPRGSPGGDHSASPIHLSGNILLTRDDLGGAICS